MSVSDMGRVPGVGVPRPDNGRFRPDEQYVNAETAALMDALDGELDRIKLHLNMFTPKFRQDFRAHLADIIDVIDALAEQ